jgi:hypothetical protein
MVIRMKGCSGIYDIFHKVLFSSCEIDAEGSGLGVLLVTFLIFETAERVSSG